MDENTLRFLLADVLTDEPPMGPVARNALRVGIRIRAPPVRQERSAVWLPSPP